MHWFVCLFVCLLLLYPPHEAIYITWGFQPKHLHLLGSTTSSFSASTPVCAPFWFGYASYPLHCQAPLTPVTTSTPESEEHRRPWPHWFHWVLILITEGRRHWHFFLESKESHLFLFSLRPVCKHCDCRLQCVNVENAYGSVPYFVTLSLSFSSCSFSPFKHFSIKRLWAIFFISREEEERGGGVGVRGVFWYIILLPEKFCLSPGLWDSLSHTISIASPTGKLTHLQSLQPNNSQYFFFDYCHLTWKSSKDTDTTHFATPAGERRAAEWR